VTGPVVTRSPRVLLTLAAVAVAFAAADTYVVVLALPGGVWPWLARKLGVTERRSGARSCRSMRSASAFAACLRSIM